jgi:hypothetical protein
MGATMGQRLVRFERGNLLSVALFESAGTHLLNGVPLVGGEAEGLAALAQSPDHDGRYDYFCGRCGHLYGKTDVLIDAVFLDHVCPFCARVDLVLCYCRECGLSIGVAETDAQHEADAWHHHYKAERPDPDAPYDRCLG